MEFDYDLFEDAKSAIKDATLKMIQIKTNVTKAKSIPLPDLLNTAAIHAVLDQVLTIKDNAMSINSMLNDWSAAIDEAYRIQSEEEYDRLMGEYEDVQAKIDAFASNVPAGRVTLEQGLAMNEEAGELHEQRDELDKRLTELEAILGVKRENEYQWWDDLVATSKEIGSDVKDLCGDYKDMFSSIGTDAFADNFDNVIQGTINLDEKIDATTAQVGSDITRGVGNLVEKAVDFSTQVGSWLLLNTGTTGVIFNIADLLGSDIKDTVEDWTKTLVSTEVANNLYNDFYGTEHGKKINDLSYIKYDSTIADSINEGTQSLVETGVAVGLSVFATPAAGAAFMGLVKGGEAVQKAYSNGATYNEATAYGTIEAATNAGMWYVLGKSGEGVKALTTSASIFGKDASLKLLGTYALKNAGVVGAKPFIDALAEKITYNSETTLSDILTQNNTLFQSLAGMSMAGLLTYIPGYFMIDKATTSIAALETLGLPAATGAAETTAYTALYDSNIATGAVSSISTGSSELGLSVISNNSIAPVVNGLVTTSPAYLPTYLPATLSQEILSSGTLLDMSGITKSIDTIIGGTIPKYSGAITEVPEYKDYFDLTSSNELGITESPYAKLVESSGNVASLAASSAPVTIEGSRILYYNKLADKMELLEPENMGDLSAPTGNESSFDNLIKQFESDKDYYETQVTDKDSFLISVKNMIKNYSRKYFEINDALLKKEILKNLSRYYDLLYYINSTKDSRRMYLLDGDIKSLPNIFVVDQKPTAFELDNNLLSSINIEQGLTETQAEELLKWTVNNTRNNLNISNKDKIGKDDVYDNASLFGACGFSQFSTLYPLQKLGLTVTINNVSTINNVRHAYGTVIIPINNNGTIVQKRYLIDCTYRQFFDIKSNVISRYIGGNSPEVGFFVIQDDAEIEFAKELLKNGFVEASPENLKKYLKPFYSMLVNPENLSQIDENFSKLDITDVLDNHQEEFDYIEEEFSDWGMNLDFNFGGITEVPEYKDYFELTSSNELGMKESPYAKLAESASSSTPVVIEGSRLVYYDKLDDKLYMTEGEIPEILSKSPEVVSTSEDIMTGTIPETLIKDAPIISTSPEVMLKKIEDFFNIDVEVRGILNSGVPIDTNQLIDPDGFLLAQQDSLLKVSKTVERKLMSISRNFEFGDEIDEIIRGKFKEFEINILNCEGGYSDLKKIYEVSYSTMRPSFVEKTKQLIHGYGINDGKLDTLLRESTSANEMLHVIHSYICNNEEYLQSTSKVAQKFTVRGEEITLYGKYNPLAKEIYEAISSDIDLGITDIVGLDDKILMMVRDLGHALSLEIEIRPDDVYVKYYIPKICSPVKVNELPGVIKVPLDADCLATTNGYFHSKKENLATDITEFLKMVPTDTDTVEYLNSLAYKPKVELVDEKGVLDYFCGPDCGEYYTDTSPNHSLNWSHNFFANDLTKGFFDGDNSYEFAYQKVASKMTDPEMVNKFYKFLDETKLGAYFKTLKCSEWEALLNYSGGISKSVNIPLIEGNQTTEFVKNTISELDSAISKFKLDTDIITYSGQSLKKFSSFGIENIDELSQLEGSLMMEKSFVSSSAIIDGAKDMPIIMEISTPAGSNCAYLGIVSSNPAENEVLYGRNTIFQINNVEYRTNSNGEEFAYMHMQVMN